MSFAMFDKLGQNLDFLMNNAHLNANELARRTGIPASSIKKIRTNNSPNPTLTTLLPLSNYFSLTLSELIGEIPLSLISLSSSVRSTSASVTSAPAERHQTENLNLLSRQLQVYELEKF